MLEQHRRIIEGRFINLIRLSRVTVLEGRLNLRNCHRQLPLHSDVKKNQQLQFLHDNFRVAKVGVEENRQEIRELSVKMNTVLFPITKHVTN